MKFSRRDFIHAGCAAGVVTLIPHFLDVAQAGLIHRSAGPPSGKNQVGLVGPTNSGYDFIFTNWWKSAGNYQLNLVMPMSTLTAAFVGGQWVATITTPADHGMFNANAGFVAAGLINLQSITGTGVPAAYKLSGAIGTPTSNTTITYVLAGDPLSYSFSAALTFQIQLATSSPIGNYGSMYGVRDNPNQFIDTNGDLQANISNATSVNITRIWATVQPNAFAPPGFTRSGHQMTVAWSSSPATLVSTPGWSARTTVGSVTTATFSLTTGQDNTNVNFVMAVADPANPPRSIFLGYTENYANWLAGIYTDPGAVGVTGYEPMLKGISGVIRYMDILQTNANGFYLYKYSDFADVATSNWSTPQRSAPIAVLTSLANRLNKHPWFNIPLSFGSGPTLGNGLGGSSNGGGGLQPIITGISKSTVGSNAIVSFSAAHPFTGGQRLLFFNCGPFSGGGGNTGFGQTATATFNIGSSFVSMTGNWPAGQQVWFKGGATIPTGLTASQYYYIVNVGVAGAGTYQLAKTVGGSPITLSGASSGTWTIVSQILFQSFIVGAVADAYHLELLNCDSSGFGTAPTTAEVTLPFSLSGITTEITNLVTAIKSQLNSQIVPRFEYGNELWNNTFIGKFWLTAQQQNFVDGSGNLIFVNPGSDGMGGYISAHIMKTIRDVYGGSGGRSKWHGVFSTQTSNSGVTSNIIAGINNYLANVLGGSLQFSDLYNDLAVTGYYGSVLQSNGRPNQAVSSLTVTMTAASPTVCTVTSGSNPMATGSPVMLTSTGTLPTDVSTGLPLQRGDGSPLVTFNIVSISGGTMATSGSPALAIGMTVYGAVTGSPLFFPTNGIVPTKITGGSGNSWTVDNAGLSIGAVSNATARDLTANTGVYWTVGTGSTFGLAQTQGGAAVNLSDMGTGIITMKCATATLICKWMNDSTALNISNPATYPSKYSYFNSTMNTELITGSQSTQPFYVNQLNSIFDGHISILASNGLISQGIGLVQYEGGNGNGVQPSAVTPAGVAMASDPQFVEFVPQAWGTAEEGAVWTAMVAAFANQPAFSSQPTLRVSYPSRFVDTGNPFVAFGAFSSVYFVDHFLGIGSPNWQNSLNQHPVYDAVAATN